MNKMLFRVLMTGAIALIGLLTGVVPELSKHSTSLTFSSSASAQMPPVTDAVVLKYAQAVWAIEPLRQTTYNDIKEIMGAKEIPTITCGEPQSLRNLPKEAKELVIIYCNRSREIVEGQGLSINQFNEITRRIQTDLALKTRVQNELIKLQD